MLQEKNNGRREKSGGKRKVNNIAGPLERPAVMVSACLAGDRCSYDGRDRFNKELMSRLFAFKVIKVCPELLGGLSSPRERCEISSGTGADVLTGKAKVLSVTGNDRSAAFVDGAHAALRIAEHLGVKLAVLKARSPSCGSGEIYSGSFDGSRKPGSGVLAALLEQNKVCVHTEEDLDAIALALPVLNCKKNDK